MIQCEKEFLDAARLRTKFDAAVNELSSKKDATVLELMVLDCWLRRRANIQASMDAYDAKHNGDRKGAWFANVYTGGRFWPQDPRPTDLNLWDIARSLSCIPRFNGHTRVPYSVAQHSVLVSLEVHPRFAKLGLFHESGEPYLGDIITPVKDLFRVPFDAIEAGIMRAASQRFEFEMSPEALIEVKRADVALLATEIRDLTSDQITNKPLSQAPLHQRITEVWGQAEAEERFKERYCELYSAEGTV